MTLPGTPTLQFEVRSNSEEVITNITQEKIYEQQKKSRPYL